MPFWFIVIHVLQKLSKQTAKCLELLKDFDLCLDELIVFALIEKNSWLSVKNQLPYLPRSDRNSGRSDVLLL